MNIKMEREGKFWRENESSEFDSVSDSEEELKKKKTKAGGVR